MSTATAPYVTHGPAGNGKFGLSVIDPVGYEMVHVYSGRMTEVEADRLAARVEAALAERGMEVCETEFWLTRIIYGSLAYQQEEPRIVANEREEG